MPSTAPKEVPTQSIYRVRPDELTSDFTQGLKATYRDREIEITVTDVVDDTAYLLSSEANKAHLLASIAQIESGSGLVSFPFDSLPTS